MNKQKRISLCIVGPSGSGKDEIGEWFEAHTDLRFGGSTSWHARQYVFREGKKRGWRYANAKECFADRHARKVEWKEIICAMNAKDPTRFYRRLAEKYPLILGLRMRHEFEACVADKVWGETLYVFRKQAEGKDPTFELKLEHADRVIPNSGSIEELHRRLGNIARGMGLEVRL